MASDLQHGAQSERTWVDALRRRTDPLRANLSLSRSLWTRRRRDLRFRVLPYDALQILNRFAVFATLTAILLVVFDPLLVPWQEKLPGSVVTFFKYVTRFGKSDWILIGTGLFVILMLILDAQTLRARLRARRSVRTFAAFYVFASVASCGIVANLAKYTIGRARPRYFSVEGTTSFDVFSGDASWASFPSGHATTAMALGMSLALLFPRLRWVFLCLGFWIAASRLFILQHYPSDMFAGCLLGGGGAWLIARAFAQRRLIFGFASDGRLIRRSGVTGRLL
jgi:membrane-associated phospholipid phosphatase